VQKSIALLALAAACAARQDPDTTRRLAALEQTVAEQQRELAQLKGAVGPSELGAVADRVDSLQDRIGKLEVRRTPPRRTEPSATAVFAVPIGASPRYGSAKAKVTMVMALDFACPYCRKAYGTVDELRKKYGADLRVVYKAMIVHPQVATLPAQAACAANHQGKWHELADRLWTESFDPQVFDQETIDRIVTETGLDRARYEADLAGPCPAEVAGEQAELSRLGVNATPTFFINGRYMSGAQPIEKFAALIDEELAKATAVIRSGVKAERYYDQEIVAKGLTSAPSPGT
jgi:protein-disulfide isomerase